MCVYYKFIIIFRLFFTKKMCATFCFIVVHFIDTKMFLLKKLEKIRKLYIVIDVLIKASFKCLRNIVQIWAEKFINFKTISIWSYNVLNIQNHICMYLKKYLIFSKTRKSVIFWRKFFCKRLRKIKNAQHFEYY